MSRRANGEGSIFKEKSGRYRIAVTVTVGGKRKRLTATAWKHAVAVEKLKKLRAQHVPSGAADQIKTVGDLIQRWMDKCCRASKTQPDKPRVSHSTLDSRERAIRLHTLPLIGERSVRDFGPADIEDLIEKLEQKKTGTAAIKWVWDVGRLSFKYGQKLSIVQANPFQIVACPKHTKKTMYPFTADEVKLVIEETRGDRIHALLVMAFFTGMRQGELFGLRWDRINLQEEYLMIDQQIVEVKGRNYVSKPKTSSSIRKISLPSIVVDALKLHRAILLREGNISSELVFPSITGTPQFRTNFWSDIWKPLLSRLAIEHRGPHNIRHTFASIALADGNDAAVISRILGHANVEITLRIYSHAIPAKEAATVNKINLMFG